MESFPVLPDLFYCYLNQLVHHTCGGGFRNAKKYYQKAGAERQIQAPPKAKTPKPSAAKGGPKRKSKANKKRPDLLFLKICQIYAVVDLATTCKAEPM